MPDLNYKVLLELGGDLPADRLCALLQKIDEAGSINRAAGDLKMSYRYGWGLIKTAEERLGAPLLTKRVGGATGGGASLTEEARRLLERYRQFRAEVEGRAALVMTPEPPDTKHPVLLATTIGPAESGVVGALEEAFLQETGIPVRHIAAGSGQALAIAREGRADLVLAHAPELEAAFLAEGFGTGRYPLMANEFLLLGPEADPAGARHASPNTEAFRRCAAAAVPFLTRGDQSGTHMQELALWAAAGVSPAAPWYLVCPRGAMGSMATLRSAEQEGAYVLVDRAAYLAARAQGLGLALLFEGDPAMRNEFALLPVSPNRFPQVQHTGAAQFVTWATGPAGQRVISQFGRDSFGEPLFTPIAQ
jgi:tungstate transport system substrate-binding protein